MICLIVAMDMNDGIGFNNKLPWHLPADLKFFKNITFGQVVIMGRKTFESIGKPLPGRINIILTRQSDFKVPGAFVVHQLPEALDLAPSFGTEKICIIGGAHVYQQSLPLAQTIYLTRVHETFETDTKLDLSLEGFEEAKKEFRPKDEQNLHDLTFYEYRRSKGGA